MTVLFDIPPAAALIAGLAGIATYIFVTLCDLEREEPVGVIRDDEF